MLEINDFLIASLLLFALILYFDHITGERSTPRSVLGWEYRPLVEKIRALFDSERVEGRHNAKATTNAIVR